MFKIYRLLINSIPPIVGGAFLLMFGARPGRSGTLGDFHYRIFQLDIAHGSLLIGGWLLLGAGLGCAVAGITRKFYVGEFQTVPDEGTRFIWESHRVVTTLCVSGMTCLATGTILFGNP